MKPVPIGQTPQLPKEEDPENPLTKQHHVINSFAHHIGVEKLVVWVNQPLQKECRIFAVGTQTTMIQERERENQTSREFSSEPEEVSLDGRTCIRICACVHKAKPASSNKNREKVHIEKKGRP